MNRDPRRYVSRLAQLMRVFAAAILAVIVLAPLPSFGDAPGAGSSLHRDMTFYAYAKNGEYLEIAFPRVGTSGVVAHVTLTKPDGTIAATCQSGAVDECAANRFPVDQTGVWTIGYDVTDGTINPRHNWRITVYGSEDGDDATLGRVWTEKYYQYQSGATNLTLWLATREGYRYRAQMDRFDGIGSIIESNGFGMVHADTCTPTYESAEGFPDAGSGQTPLDPAVEYSGSVCGDAYKIFFAEPAADLPATSTSARGPEWIAPDVVPASVDDLTFTASGPGTRAGDISFDLAGVNGGYTVQIDVNANGSYDDAVDRTIPWGSPPGAITIPFDGLDGTGAPIGLCQDMNARVVVDRAGEMHLTLADVESLPDGIRLSGATPGISSTPLLHWDDRNLTTQGRSQPTPVLDARAGVDAATAGQHGWNRVTSNDNWGNERMIENWSYYSVTAGDEVAIAPPCSPGLDVVKHADLNDTNDNGLADVGETIDFTFDVTNTGTADLSDVTVDDPKVTGISPASLATLASGAPTYTFTADPYEVTQADVDAGGVFNSATATGVFDGDDVDSPPSTTTTVTPNRDPGLSVVKTSEFVTDGGTAGIADRGDVLRYTFTAKNTGNVTLTGVSIDDAKVAGITPASATLVPGAEREFTADYTVTQADVNSGGVYNVATATGTSPLGPIVSVPDDDRVPGPDPDPDVTIVKKAELTTDGGTPGKADKNDVITYTFTVHNGGPGTAYDISVDDDLDGLSAIAPASVASLDPGEDAVFTATYTVTQDDVDAGEVLNQATATFTPPDTDPDDGETPPPLSTPPSELIVVPAVDPEPGLMIEKSATLNDDNDNDVADLGETIDYSFVVENTGNVTLDGVTVVDDRVSGLSPATVSLAPGQKQTFTADPYEVTQADLDAEAVLNSAVAQGHVPGGPETTSPPGGTSVDVPDPAPGLRIVKHATLDDENDNGKADRGEYIRYSFTVTNTGNRTLDHVVVSDPKVDGLTPAEVDNLAPGESAMFTADPYRVTADDVKAGRVVNVATVTGRTPGGDDAGSSSDEVTVPTAPPAAGGNGNGLLPDAGGLRIALLAVSAGLLATGTVFARSRRRREEGWPAQG